MNPKILVLEWLSTTIGKTEDGTKVTIIEKLAELVSVNEGNLTVTRMGKVIKNDTHWKRVGLTVVEAMQLQGLSHFLKGMLTVLGTGVEREVMEMIQIEILRQEGGSNIILPTTEQINVLTLPYSATIEIQKSKHKKG